MDGYRGNPPRRFCAPTCVPATLLNFSPSRAATVAFGAGRSLPLRSAPRRRAVLCYALIGIIVGSVAFHDAAARTASARRASCCGSLCPSVPLAQSHAHRTGTRFRCRARGATGLRFGVERRVFFLGFEPFLVSRREHRGARRDVRAHSPLWRAAHRPGAAVAARRRFVYVGGFALLWVPGELFASVPPLADKLRALPDFDGRAADAAHRPGALNTTASALRPCHIGGLAGCRPLCAATRPCEFLWLLSGATAAACACTVPASGALERPRAR